MPLSAKETVVGGVEVTLWLPEKPATVLVVLAHGRTRSKRDSNKFAAELSLSLSSTAFATWDLPNHGARIISEKLNCDWSQGCEEHFTTLLAVRDQGAAEAESILRYLPASIGELNEVKHLVIGGKSQGGHIAWKVAADHNIAISGAFPLISSPDLASMFKDRWACQTQFAADNVVAFPPPIVAMLEEEKKSRDALRGSSLPMLALCGGDDKLVPPDATAKWLAQSESNVQRAVILDGYGHEVPLPMVKLVAEFLGSLE